MSAASLIFYWSLLFLCVSIGASLRFRCDDNTLINSESICNGHPDCRDASDETLTICHKMACDDGYVKCEYGACVKDGNDCFNRPYPPKNGKASSCTIDNIPKNGFVWISHLKKRLRINDVLDEFTQIEYTCIENHYIVGNATNFCDNGKWENAVPDCQPRCSPSTISSITFLASCYIKMNDREMEVRCTDPAHPGTIARINCKWGYQSLNTQIQLLTCDNDGRWFPLPNQCTQICGEEAVDGVPFIVGGENANVKNVPWHVGIYTQFGNKSDVIVCGGTIISAKVVISAAHCFWNRLRNEFNSCTEYRIVAGKYYRNLNDPRESNTYQSLGIEKIDYMSGYNDYDGLFANDVAVIVLNKFIEFKLNVAPACIEEYKFDDKIVQPGLIGRVAGWGLIEPNGDTSSTLKQIDLPVIQREHCIKHFNQGFRPFFTSDKFCAGYLTGIGGVCSGDSGGGLVFPKRINDKIVYYLRGIVSTGQNKDGSCDTDTYALFTNTAYFWDLIEHHIIANRPTIVNSAVQLNDAIKCDPIQGEHLLLSKCFRHGLQTECGEGGEGGEAIDIGTSITTMCAKGHESRLAIVHTCQVNGIWWPPVEHCNPICGRTSSLPYTPWLVTIYASIGSSLPLIGSGVIVSQRVVLTYAEESFQLFTADISALQIYGAVLHYFDNGNTENQQYRKVTKRYLHQNPVDFTDRTFAVLIMDKPFEFNADYVGPVCLDFTTRDNNDGEIVTTAAYGVNEGRILQSSYTLLENSDCKSNDTSNDTNILKELSRGKMCARRPETVDGNCPMVEGTALVSSDSKNGITISYLRGIAIKGMRTPQYDRCVDDEFQMFININDFKNHIQHYIMRFSDKNINSLQSSKKSCRISSSIAIDDGTLSMFESVEIQLSVGDEVQHLDIIEYSCKSGHRLFGSNINVCMNGVWNKTAPRCELDSLKSMEKCADHIPPTNGFVLQTETKLGPSYLIGCNTHFYLPPKYPTQSYCQNGKWIPEIPKRCFPGKACSPIIETTFTLSQCSSNGLVKLCSQTNDIGSTVTTTCIKGYETRSSVTHTCAPNGEWWPPVTKCDAICGQTKSLPFIPWLASIYVPKNGILPLIGSGVIVSERVVLTYADESYDLFTHDISTLQVYGAVLHYYDDEHIDNQQFRRVADRFLHENPIDSSDRTFAVLIMDKPFDFNGNFVAPVCLDFSTSFFHGALYGETGSVAAYGAKEGPIIHNFYKILDDLECKSNDETIEKELNRGKLCARIPQTINGNCAMVVGAGLVTSIMEKGDDVFYLKGIAIQGFNNTQYKRCVDDEFQLFININYFKDTIRKYIAEYN